MSLTYQEIKDEYLALDKTFSYLSECKKALVDFYHQVKPKSIVCVGSGSSYCLCRSADLSAKLRLGLPATSFTAGDLMLNYKAYKPILDQSLLLAPSRSGKTTELLLAVERTRTVAESAVLGVVCTETPELATDFMLKLPWAFDESVCQTRSVVNLYAANLLVMAYLSRDLHLVEAIKQAIATGERFMEQWEAKLATVAEEEWSNALVLADGEVGGLAEEGALAFSEIARVKGSFYHVLDVRHGPMVLIDHNTLALVCLNADGFDYQKALIEDLIKKGATVITYSDLALPEIPGVKLQVSSGLQLGPAAYGLHFIFLPQILAYYKAIHKKVNPDQPEGLEPWIKF